MAFQSVFWSLREVFPQIDLRLLKAVAIEHSEDTDAAVEFILSDVLPNDAHLSPEIGLGKQAVPEEHEEVDEVNMTLLMEGNLVRRRRASDHDTNSAIVNSTGILEAVDEGSQVGYAGDPKEPGFFMPHYDSFDRNIYPSPHKSPNYLVDNRTGFTPNLNNGDAHLGDFLSKTMVDAVLSDAHGENNSKQLSSNAKLEKKSLDELFQFCVKVGENVNDADTMHAIGEHLDELNAKKSVAAVDASVKNPSSANVEKCADLVEYGAAVEVDTGHHVSESVVQQSQHSVEPSKTQDLYGLEPNDAASSTFISGQDTLLTVCDKTSGSMDSGGVVQNGIVSTSSEYIEQQCLSKSELPSVDLPSTLATRTGHLISIELLEELVIDAKNNKKNLLSAKELVTNLMKEVEQLEERVHQTKEEAFTAGQDILHKVEELKQTLKHAKEANDMHAGEVYGEKAILATEARELQCRLLILSDERDKSLSVIEEIRQALEARRSAAEEEMATLEQVKLEREELAGKALTEQQLIMGTIVEESKKLHQQAEENSKLGEYLMDRGHIVDALQGEIAVICEDVILLKARVDGRIPLNKSQRSTSSLASPSSSSCHKSVHSLDDVLQDLELDDQDSKRQQLESSNNNGEEVHVGSKLPVPSDDKEVHVGSKLPVPSDDDWAFFEFEA